MSKLGIIIIEDFGGALKWAIENKPTAVEFMLTRPLDTRPMEEISPGVKVSQVDLVRMLAEASPKTLLVIRAYPDDYDHGDFQERMLSWSEPFREVSDRVVAHSVNEVVPFNPEEARGLNAYEIAFIERMVANGLIPMCFCLSESHLRGPTIEKDAQGKETGKVLNSGDLPLWQHMKDGVRLLAEKGGLLGLNEYDWPSWNSSRAWGHKWRLGHWQLNTKFIRQYAGMVPAVGIGESVLDGKIMTSRLPGSDRRYNKPWGYRKDKSADQYMADIRAIEAQSYWYPGVAFFLLFAWAPGHRDWDSYDVSVMRGLLAEYLRQSPPQYWDPKEKEKMVDSPLASWREGVPLGNYSKGPTEKTEIVLHSTGGSFTSAVNWFLNPESGFAAQYVIGRGHAGVPKIYQLVREEDIGHHAGKWEVNTKSIGIECADDNLDHLTAPQRERLIALCKDIVARNPIERIRLHREIVATKCPQAISNTEGAQIIKEVLGGSEPDDDREELLARIAELETREAECLAELIEAAKIRKDDKAGMTAARNILNERIDRKP